MRPTLYQSTEQVVTLHDLDKMIETIKDLYDKHIVLAGDFNFFSDTFIDSYGGKPTLKKKSIAKFIELKAKFDLCDIWRIRNPKTTRPTSSEVCFRFNRKTA